MTVKSYEEINEKIRAGKAVVLTAGEVAEMGRTASPEEIVKKVDVVTSRAFAALADFISLTKHLLNENGYWAAMKGVYPYEEIEHIPASVEVVKVEKIDVPMLDAERHMVIMRPKTA